jgi:hypothetical protein
MPQVSHTRHENIPILWQMSNAPHCCLVCLLCKASESTRGVLSTHVKEPELAFQGRHHHLVHLNILAIKFHTGHTCMKSQHHNQSQLYSQQRYDATFAYHKS